METHAVVVGGTRGIGRELVRVLSAEGVAVSVIGKRPPVDRDREVPGTEHWAVDLVSRPCVAGALADIVGRRGKLHYLVFLQRFRGEGDRWDGELATSLTATKNAIEQFADHFDVSADCGIAIVSSVADRYVLDGQTVGYHVAKAGLDQMVRYYAVELGPRGIRVNSVSPGTILKEENRDFYLSNTALQGLFQKMIPLRRMGTSLDAANVIAFLCSPKAAYVTGQNIVVDGGISLRGQEPLARHLMGI